MRQLCVVRLPKKIDISLWYGHNRAKSIKTYAFGKSNRKFTYLLQMLLFSTANDSICRFVFFFRSLLKFISSFCCDFSEFCFYELRFRYSATCVIMCLCQSLPKIYILCEDFGFQTTLNWKHISDVLAMDILVEPKEKN